MLQDVKDLTAPGVIKGLNTQYNFLTLSKDQSPNMMDVKVNYDGSFEKRLGSHIQNITSITGGSAATAGFSPTTSSILTSFVSYWPLNETSGNRADSFGSAVMQQSGGVLYASGKNNQAALFVASSSQFLQAASSQAFTNNPEFSYSSWFYLNSTGGTVKRTILSKRSSGASADNTGVLLLHGDGNDASTTITDSSAVPKTVTAVGNAQIDTAQKKFGTGSILFDGTGDYLTVPDSDDWDLIATDPLTIDFWVRFNSVGTNTMFSRGDSETYLMYNAGTWSWYLSGGVAAQATHTPSANTWYHIACVKINNGVNGCKLFIDGTVGSVSNQHNAAIATANILNIGSLVGGTNPHNGWIDEFRWVKGTAIWTTNFTPPTAAYSSGTQGVFEYSLNVGTDNLVTFDVSSSGTVANGSVSASSFGAVGTGTWYHALAWYSSAQAQIGIVVNESFPVIKSYTGGIIAGSALFTLGVENTSNYMDGRIDEVGFWTKRMGSDGIAILYNKGSGNTYASTVDATPWASFDFGASSIRWLTAAAGTGVYASSNLGLTWVNIGTSQSSTYQYFDRSKNVLIKTSDAYDAPLYWAGSVGTYMVEVGNSAPLCKYSANFQGFLILLNSQARKRSFNYIDENFQLSSTAWLNFDLPSSADDEITAVFTLRRYLYVSTRYKIYRVSYVGGNPDWQYVEVKSWGFIPRTAKKVVIMNNQQGQTSTYSIGEVVVGLTFDRKLRIFDGSGDQLLSSNVEKDNGMCDFALDKITYLGSGPVISFAELDPIPNVYRLCVAIGQDSQQTTHFLNYDGRSQALYPYSNMNFNCMTVAESANKQFLMAFDRNGFCHMMDSGNLDGDATPINDYFESPLMFDKTPSQSSKGHKTDLFFSGTTSGRVYYQDRTDFSNTWKERRDFVLSGSENKLVNFIDVDVPETYNTYQFRITSSAGTSNPWRMQRYDFFTKGLGIGKNY